MTKNTTSTNFSAFQKGKCCVLDLKNLNFPSAVLIGMKWNIRRQEPDNEIKGYRRNYAFNPKQRVYSNLKDYKGINEKSVRLANQKVYGGLSSENLKTH